MFRIFFVTVLIFTITNSHAKPIVSGISSNEINIDTKFNGTNILLFGAKGDAGNIVIAVRGPKKNFLVTKKERLLGVWYNGQRAIFDNVGSFYSLFSTFDNNKTSNELLQSLELGSANIKYDVKSNSSKKEEDNFQLQLINKLEKDSLYSQGANKIDFLDETLFKVIIKFPKNIAQGVYTVEIYLINEDNLLSFQSIPIYVNQIGVSADISKYAHQQSLLYGIFSVIIALIIGWAANYLFTKFIGK